MTPHACLARQLQSWAANLPPIPTQEATPALPTPSPLLHTQTYLSSVPSRGTQGSCLLLSPWASITPSLTQDKDKGKGLLAPSRLWVLPAHHMICLLKASSAPEPSMIAPGLHSRCPSRARLLVPSTPPACPTVVGLPASPPSLGLVPCPTDLLYPLLCLSPTSPCPSDARQLRLLPLSSLGLTLGATSGPTPRWAHSWHLLFAE